MSGIGSADSRSYHSLLDYHQLWMIISFYTIYYSYLYQHPQLVYPPYIIYLDVYSNRQIRYKVVSFYGV